MTVGDESGTRPRLLQPLTMEERLQTEAEMSSASGLPRDRFAMNSFGFPPIPLPAVRRDDDRVRCAPAEVNLEYLGHPVYWIEPRLTEVREGETEEAWCIRMFFLILGFGLWTEDLLWINYPRSRDLRYDSDTAHAYHMLGSPTCALDDLPLLTAEELVRPQEEIQDSYRLTLHRCRQILDREVRELTQAQHRACRYADSVLGDLSRFQRPSAEMQGGLWSRTFRDPLGGLAEEYRRRVEEGFGVSDLVDPLYSLMEQLRDTMVEFDRTAAMLFVPVMRRMETDPQTYGYMATQLSAAADQADQRVSRYDLSAIAADHLRQPRRPDDVHRTVGAAYELYRSCWSRLRLARVNYDRVRDGEEPFSSSASLDTAHARSAERTARQGGAAGGAVSDATTTIRNLWE